MMIRHLRGVLSKCVATVSEHTGVFLGLPCTAFYIDVRAGMLGYGVKLVLVTCFNSTATCMFDPIITMRVWRELILDCLN